MYAYGVFLKLLQKIGGKKQEKKTKMGENCGGRITFSFSLLDIISGEEENSFIWSSIIRHITLHVGMLVDFGLAIMFPSTRDIRGAFGNKLE